MANEARINEAVKATTHGKGEFVAGFIPKSEVNVPYNIGGVTGFIGKAILRIGSRNNTGAAYAYVNVHDKKTDVAHRAATKDRQSDTKLVETLKALWIEWEGKKGMQLRQEGSKRSKNPAVVIGDPIPVTPEPKAEQPKAK